jgi:AcrR family transcriptional regulator
VNGIDEIVNTIYTSVMPNAEADLTPRARHRIECRRRILDAAGDAIAAAGIDGLSMNRLARSVGFTPGALYRYFTSRDALIATLAIEVLEELAATLRELARLAPDDEPLQRVLLLVDGYRGYSIGRPNHFAFLSTLVGDPRVLVASEAEARKVMGAIARALEPVAVALADAVDEGHLEPGDAARRALVLFASVQGTLQMRKQARVAGGRIDVDRMLAELLEALLRGWGVEASLLRRTRESMAALAPLADRVGGLT